ncbi:hypothetical protein [Nocardia miyunensis]|uniref:hypothetical protein n=1 Tax=Nocardia miyunensis TaxID=282684 RepID=UPI00082D4982|nr:hypothetical protein [Nocardia miyunensis]
MDQRERTLNVAQARVLRVLNWGGMVAERRVAESAGLRRNETRRALAILSGRFLVRKVSRIGGVDRFEITDTGRAVLATENPPYGALPQEPLRAKGIGKPLSWIRLR